MGDAGLQEPNYADLLKDGGTKTFKQTGGWIGMTDKYWAATLIPDNNAHLEAHFTFGQIGNVKTYQTDYLLDAQTIFGGRVLSRGN